MIVQLHQNYSDLSEIDFQQLERIHQTGLQQIREQKLSRQMYKQFQQFANVVLLSSSQDYNKQQTQAKLNSINQVLDKQSDDTSDNQSDYNGKQTNRIKSNASSVSDLEALINPTAPYTNQSTRKDETTNIQQNKININNNVRSLVSMYAQKSVASLQKTEMLSQPSEYLNRSILRESVSTVNYNSNNTYVNNSNNNSNSFMLAKRLDFENIILNKDSNPFRYHQQQQPQSHQQPQNTVKKISSHSQAELQAEFKDIQNAHIQKQKRRKAEIDKINQHLKQVQQKIDEQEDPQQNPEVLNAQKIKITQCDQEDDYFNTPSSSNDVTPHEQKHICYDSAAQIGNYRSDSISNLFNNSQRLKLNESYKRLQPSSSRTSLSTIHGGAGGAGSSNKNNTTIKLDEIISKMQLNCIDIDNVEGGKANNNVKTQTSQVIIGTPQADIRNISQQQLHQHALLNGEFTAEFNNEENKSEADVEGSSQFQELKQGSEKLDNQLSSKMSQLIQNIRVTNQNRHDSTDFTYDLVEKYLNSNSNSSYSLNNSTENTRTRNSHAKISCSQDGNGKPSSNVSSVCKDYPFTPSLTGAIISASSSSSCLTAAINDSQLRQLTQQQGITPNVVSISNKLTKKNDRYESISKTATSIAQVQALVRKYNTSLPQNQHLRLYPTSQLTASDSECCQQNNRSSSSTSSVSSCRSKNPRYPSPALLNAHALKQFASKQQKFSNNQSSSRYSIQKVIMNKISDDYQSSTIDRISPQQLIYHHQYNSEQQPQYKDKQDEDDLDKDSNYSIQLQSQTAFSEACHQRKHSGQLIFDKIEALQGLFGQNEERSPSQTSGRPSKIGKVGSGGYGQQFLMKKNVKSNTSSSNILSNKGLSTKGGTSLIGRGINSAVTAKK